MEWKYDYRRERRIPGLRLVLRLLHIILQSLQTFLIITTHSESELKEIPTPMKNHSLILYLICDSSVRLDPPGSVYKVSCQTNKKALFGLQDLVIFPGRTGSETGVVISENSSCES